MQREVNRESADDGEEIHGCKIMRVVFSCLVEVGRCVQGNGSRTALTTRAMLWCELCCHDRSVGFPRAPLRKVRRVTETNSENVTMDQTTKYAVIQIWRRGWGFSVVKKPQFDETFEVVNWFETKRDARKYFRDEPQGQTEHDGECNRMLMQIHERRR